MSQFIYGLLLFSFTSRHVIGLKLLVTEDVVEDDDDTWESDISFSYKPYKGKCTKGSGDSMVTADITKETYPSENQPGGPNAVAPLGTATGCYTSNAGRLSKWHCHDGSGPAYSSTKEVEKYCKSSATGWPSDGKDFGDVQEGVRTMAAHLKWKPSKYIHYLAKLATMNNKFMKTLVNTAGAGATKFNQHYVCSTKYVKAFDLKPSDYAVEAKFYIVEATGGTKTGDPEYYCYSEAGIAWAKNDPVVKNMDGEEFEIMATGTFSLLSLKESSRTVFEASAAIDRAGTRCGATYIQNLTLSGQWVEDIGVASIQAKAEAAVPKVQALQINFAGEWQSAASKFSYAAVKKADAKKIIIQLNKLEVLVSVDSHRIHEAGIKTTRFANFLNVNFQGISKLSGFSVGGLLGRDSHDEATQLPDGCGSEALASTEEKGMLSSMELA